LPNCSPFFPKNLKTTIQCSFCNYFHTFSVISYV
jgi:hypothetical protein